MSRASRAIKKTGRIIKWIIACIIAFMIGCLLWRIFTSGDPKSVRLLSVNEDIRTAYEENGNELEMFTQEQNTITRAEYNAGYFSVTDHVLIPDANQIQLIFRYNNSTIRALQEDYALAELPSRDEELFDVTVLLAIDLTPEITEDNAGNDEESVRFVRVHAAAEPTVDQTSLYNYRRFTFDIGEGGEDLAALLDEGLLLAVYTDIYYVNDLDYEQRPYGTLCLYDYLSNNVSVSLSGDDRRAIEAFE